ncbi:MAG: methyltransferase domain-containing protein [Lentisphaerae bacterium]|nr:methyltransferase domain-containing protein [Lentisphaerota bacterium]MCP4100013.1 methyltransferase domain-containing protein [Lentisphaerota bacterium]
MDSTTCTGAYPPRSYTAIEHDKIAANKLKEMIESNKNAHRHVITGDIADPIQMNEESCSVIYGEASLTMHRDEKKLEILKDIYRVLKPGGRLGIHEISLTTNELPDGFGKQMTREAIRATKHPIWIMSVEDWLKCLIEAGFKIEQQFSRPVHLLEMERLIEDEGVDGAMRFMWNTMNNSVAAERIMEIKTFFCKYEKYLTGNCVVCRKPE